MARRGLVGLLAAAAVVTGCTGSGDVHAVISARPVSAMFDQPVSVSISGLPARARTTVTASSDADGTRWSSSAEFTAGADGTVSLDRPPVSGSYSGANPMGLLQSMTPPAGSKQTTFAPAPDGYDVTLRASVNGKSVASAQLHRLAPSPAAGVVARDLRVPADGIYGTLYRLKDSGTRRPAVLFFGGSEGGLPTYLRAYAALLAGHGYPSLALAYFKAPGLPATLTRVPLEYFTKALGVLRAQPGVDPRRVFVMGASRGGEGALLLGATFPQLVNGVVAFVPGSYVNSALPPERGRSAWTLAGRDLPYVPAIKFGAPAASVDPRAVIPVERIDGPVLLTCGGLDLQWPSCSFVDDVTQRLTAHHFRHPVTVLRYPDGGHLSGDIPPGALYTSQTLAHLGGTVAAAQQSSVEAEAKILALLADR